MHNQGSAHECGKERSKRMKFTVKDRSTNAHAIPMLIFGWLAQSDCRFL